MGTLAFNRKQLVLVATVVCVVSFSCAAEEQLEFDEFCDSRGLYLCNASEPSCYEPLAEFVACLREKPLLSMPQIEVISVAEWRAEVSSSVESESGQNLEHLVTGLELFDRFPSTRPTPEERIDTIAEQLLIERSAELIQFVDHGAGFASQRHHLELARALASSMLQQEYDYEALEALSEGDPSYRSAIANVLFATTLLASNMVYSALEGESFWSSPWLSSFQTREQELDEALKLGTYGLERFIGRQAPLPDLYGQKLLHNTWRRGQSSAVEELLAALPTSTDALGQIAGVRFGTGWSPESGDHLVLAAESPSLANGLIGFEHVSEFVMGSWFTAYFLYRAVPESDDPFLDPQPSWQADQFWVFHNNSSKATAGMWLWAPKDDRAASDWEARLAMFAADNGKPWRVTSERIGDVDVVGLVACDDETTLDLWEAELEKVMRSASLRPSNASSGP